MTEPSLKDQITIFVKEAYEREGRVPSIAETRRELKFSTRRLYSVFPGGLEEICKHAGVPVPTRRLKTVRKALDSRSKRKVGEEAGKGELAALVFDLLEKGKPLPQVVITLKITPDVAKELHDKWLGLKEVDVNQPGVLRGLRALKGLAESMCRLCRIIDLILFTLDDYAPQIFQGKEFDFLTYNKRLSEIKSENFRVLGTIIRACKRFNSSLSSSILKKSMELLGFDSLRHFIEDNGFRELGIEVDDLKGLGAEELERLGATSEDLKRLRFKVVA